MHRAKDRDRWDRLSILLAHTANLNRDPKTRPHTPQDFNAYGTDGKLRTPTKRIAPDFTAGMRALFPNLKGSPNET